MNMINYLFLNQCGERIRIAYEKKCIQLRNQDVNGDEPGAVDRTRAAIRDLHTRLKVSMHTVESVSMRIEKLRDEELHPQLLELLQGSVSSSSCFHFYPFLFFFFLSTLCDLVHIYI